MRSSLPPAKDRADLDCARHRRHVRRCAAIFAYDWSAAAAPRGASAAVHDTARARGRPLVAVYSNLGPPSASPAASPSPPRSHDAVGEPSPGCGRIGCRLHRRPAHGDRLRRFAITAPRSCGAGAGRSAISASTPPALRFADRQTIEWGDILSITCRPSMPRMIEFDSQTRAPLRPARPRAGRAARLNRAVGFAPTDHAHGLERRRSRRSSPRRAFSRISTLKISITPSQSLVVCRSGNPDRSRDDASRAPQRQRRTGPPC